MTQQKLDREKVIKGIQECNLNGGLIGNCPYKGILFLLKEQEAVKPVRDEQTGRIWLCGKCGSYVGFEDNDPYDPNDFAKYCRDCGTPVLWEGR